MGLEIEFPCPIHRVAAGPAGPLLVQLDDRIVAVEANGRRHDSGAAVRRRDAGGADAGWTSVGDDARSAIGGVRAGGGGHKEEPSDLQSC